MTDKKLRSGEDSIVQKQAGKAVQERQTRFRRISAITSDIAYSCHTRKDGRFSIDWMTGAAERITGYSIEEIKAHGCWRFLVVEDEPVVCAVAQALLTRSGCAVLAAPDGASALATFREHGNDVDLILLDMTMPGMTTDQIVQAIRALNRKVPILLNSGYTSNDTVKRMLDEGTVKGSCQNRTNSLSC